MPSYTFEVTKDYTLTVEAVDEESATALAIERATDAECDPDTIDTMLLGVDEE